MKFPNFCGPAYVSQSRNVTIDETINLTLERVEVGGKNTFVLYKRPGYFLFAQPTILRIVTACPTVQPEIGVPYSFTFQAVGGNLPYTWTADGLPDGLTLVASQDTLTAELSGTVTEGGSFNYTITVTDADGDSAGISCEFLITTGELTAECPENQPSLALAYTGQIVVTGGVPPYTYLITGGALPDGLTLDLNTGIISGTPTESGNFPWIATITDAVDTIFELECEFDIACWTIIAQTSKAGDFNGVTTDPIDTTGADFIICCCSDTALFMEILSDSYGNNWYPLGGAFVAPFGARIDIFWTQLNGGPITAGPNHTFSSASVNCLFAGCYTSIAVLAVAGAAPFMPLDADWWPADTMAGPLPLTNSLVTPTTNTAQTGSITPNRMDELIIACVNSASTGQSHTVDSGMIEFGDVQGVGGTNYALCAAYKIQTAAAAINPEFAWGGDPTSAVAAIACFISACDPRDET